MWYPSFLQRHVTCRFGSIPQYEELDDFDDLDDTFDHDGDDSDFEDSSSKRKKSKKRDTGGSRAGRRSTRHEVVDDKPFSCDS